MWLAWYRISKSISKRRQDTATQSKNRCQAQRADSSWSKSPLSAGRDILRTKFQEIKWGKHSLSERAYSKPLETNCFCYFTLISEYIQEIFKYVIHITNIYYIYTYAWKRDKSIPLGDGWWCKCKPDFEIHEVMPILCIYKSTYKSTLKTFAKIAIKTRKTLISSRNFKSFYDYFFLFVITVSISLDRQNAWAFSKHNES